MKIDLISDLHIEMWDQQYNIKNACGERSNNPLNINIFKNSESKILIVAGDTSDDLELSIKKMYEIGKYYDKVLFVDGNHEHVIRIPNIFFNYEIEEIANRVNKKDGNRNNKLHFLSSSPYQIGSTIIIGNNCWWDYNNWDDKTIKMEIENYFKGWIKISKDNSQKFSNNCMIQAKKDYNDLKQLINKYENDISIDNIIIVTHTVPIDIFANKFNMGVMGNSEIIKLTHKSSKISHWLFGHTHVKYDYKYNDIRYVSNPRGRPDDQNGEKYRVKTIEI